MRRDSKKYKALTAQIEEAHAWYKAAWHRRQTEETREGRIEMQNFAKQAWAEAGRLTTERDGRPVTSSRSPRKRSNNYREERNRHADVLEIRQNFYRREAAR